MRRRGGTCNGTLLVTAVNSQRVDDVNYALHLSSYLFRCLKDAIGSHGPCQGDKATLVDNIYGCSASARILVQGSTNTLYQF